MKKIGCFRQDNAHFCGNITTLQFSVQARLVPVEGKDAAAAPDYRLVQTKANGYAPEIGAGWKRRTRDGHDYIEVEIDDPSCLRPILAHLWRGDDGLWYLFWNRHATGTHDPESLYVQEELKPPMAWHRAPQKITAYLHELFPQLAI